MEHNTVRIAPDITTFLLAARSSSVFENVKLIKKRVQRWIKHEQNREEVLREIKSKVARAKKVRERDKAEEEREAEEEIDDGDEELDDVEEEFRDNKGEEEVANLGEEEIAHNEGEELAEAISSSEQGESSDHEDSEAGHVPRDSETLDTEIEMGNDSKDTAQIKGGCSIEPLNDKSKIPPKL